MNKEDPQQRFERWLKAGPEILSNVSKEEAKRARRLFFQTILVELHADGLVRVFGDESIQVKIVNRPVASTNKNDIRVEELIDSVLPQRYREVYWPGPNLRAMGNYKPITVMDVAATVAQLNMIDELPGSDSRFTTAKRKQLAAIEA